MDLILFNTLSGKKEHFQPLLGTDVTLYTCGPTVYKSQHIGNYRTFLFEDTLKRTLMINGYHVRHIMNITDVGHLVSDEDEGEDKIAKEARLQGKSAWDIAKAYEEEFKNDLLKLNILPPGQFVRATDHIQEQIHLIQRLEKKGYTYRISDGIYFDSSKVPEYGKLNPKNIKGIRSGKRVNMGEKRNATDFALWKFSDPKGPARQMLWESPWGTGFPGWHIECSAMSMKYLGDTIDIHCGGADHIPVHHTNEIAQSESATGKPFVHTWMHAAFLKVNGQKMAKSSPETNITISVLEERDFSPLDYRYLTLGTHYRKPLSFSWDALESARQSRLKLLRQFIELPRDEDEKKDKLFQEKLISCMNDDLNTAKALALTLKAVQENISQKTIVFADHFLGLNILKESKSLSSEILVPAEIQNLAQKREEFRKQKNWNAADETRMEIEKQGWTIKDTPSGPSIHRL